MYTFAGAATATFFSGMRVQQPITEHKSHAVCSVLVEFAAIACEYYVVDDDIVQHFTGVYRLLALVHNQTAWIATALSEHLLRDMWGETDLSVEDRLRVYSGGKCVTRSCCLLAHFIPSFSPGYFGKV